MKYLKQFANESDYQAFKESEEYITPNVSYVVENSGVAFSPYVTPPPIAVGDVAYLDGSKVRTCSLDDYDSSMGTAVGVVVIPNNFLPDRKARIISLNGRTYKKWGPAQEVADLTNYNRVPITDNKTVFALDNNTGGYIPTDTVPGALQSYWDSLVDPDSKYIDVSENYIPSPYLSDGSLNPEFLKDIDGYNNPLSDFNGKNNTDILVALGSNYELAYYAKNYSEVENDNIDWYLPACGEMAVMMTRLNKINESLLAIGGKKIPKGAGYNTSTEYNENYVYGVAFDGWVIYNKRKASSNNGCAFAMID